MPQVVLDRLGDAGAVVPADGGQIDVHLDVRDRARAPPVPGRPQRRGLLDHPPRHREAPHRQPSVEQ
ncbi:hypothetical protein [Dactylosporangium cerinum]